MRIFIHFNPLTSIVWCFLQISNFLPLSTVSVWWSPNVIDAVGSLHLCSFLFAMYCVYPTTPTMWCVARTSIALGPCPRNFQNILLFCAAWGGVPKEILLLAWGQIFDPKKNWAGCTNGWTYVFLYLCVPLTALRHGPYKIIYKHCWLKVLSFSKNQATTMPV